MAKRLTNYISDLGRVIAFYPGLTNVTGSTNTTVFLCQLLYWSDKTKDPEGWIWKDSEQLKEETGLTYNEQKTAREKLVNLGILEEEYKRLSHTTVFRINKEILDNLWEEISGKEKKIEEKEPEKEKKESAIEYIYVGEDTRYSVVPETANSVHPTYLIETIDTATGEVTRTRKSAVAPIKDPLAKFLGLQTQSPDAIKAREMFEIKNKLEEKFHINADNTRWEKFIEFCWKREKQHGESIDTFISWAFRNGYDPIYWTPPKMKELYPTCFSEKKPREDFVEPLPIIKKKDIAPLPEDFGRKKSLY